MLAKIKEDRGEIADAANILQELQVKEFCYNPSLVNHELLPYSPVYIFHPTFWIEKLLRNLHKRCLNWRWDCKGFIEFRYKICDLFMTKFRD